MINVRFQMSEVSIHLRKRTHFLLGEAVPSNDKSWYLKTRVEKPVSGSRSRRAAACGNLIPWFVFFIACVFLKNISLFQADTVSFSYRSLRAG